MRHHYFTGLFTWKSVAKLSITLITLATILFGYWTALFNYNDTPFSGVVINFRSMLYWSFFSTQVNALVLFYFVNIFLFYRSEGITILTGFTMRLIIAVYTTFIVLVYWTAVFPLDWVHQNYTIKNWYVIMFLQNGIVPLLAISYLIVTNNNKIFYLRNFMKRKLGFIFLHPGCYLIFIIVGSSLRWLDYYQKPDLFLINNYIDFNKINTYWFVSYNQNKSFLNLDGVLTFFLFIIIFIMLLIILGWFYLVLFNFCYRNKQRKIAKIKKHHQK